MPRPPRLEVPGVPLHVIQRGNNRGACFFGETDRRFYLKCLREAAGRYQCAIHAYVLMSNHVHLLITPQVSGGVAATLQHLGRRYVRTVNGAHGRTGTLWEGRFKSSLVDSDSYLLTCHRYIELNPVRAGIVEDPAAYPWSSHRHYALGEPNSVITDHLGYIGLGTTDHERRDCFQALFRTGLTDDELVQIRVAANTGTAIGTNQFLDQMQARVGRPVGPPRHGRPRKDDEKRQSGPQSEKLL